MPREEMRTSSTPGAAEIRASLPASHAHTARQEHSASALGGFITGLPIAAPMRRFQPDGSTGTVYAPQAHSRASVPWVVPLTKRPDGDSRGY
jgi:hypothetical protein